MPTTAAAFLLVASVTFSGGNVVEAEGDLYSTLEMCREDADIHQALVDTEFRHARSIGEELVVTKVTYFCEEYHGNETDNQHNPSK